MITRQCFIIFVVSLALQVDGEKHTVYSFENLKFIAEAVAVEKQYEADINDSLVIVEPADNGVFETDTKGQLLFENKSLIFDLPSTYASRANFPTSLSASRSKYKGFASSHNQVLCNAGFN